MHEKLVLERKYPSRHDEQAVLLTQVKHGSIQFEHNFNPSESSRYLDD
jgi:hypothetical protein